MINRIMILILTFFPVGLINSQSLTFGNTIITHGYTPSSRAPIHKVDGGNAWGYKMAKEILSKTNGKGCIWIYDKSSASFVFSEGQCQNGERILLFDWATESSFKSEGFSESAGDALFAALILGYKKGNFDLKNLHFIGHSRGTIVNTEAVERLLTLKRAYPKYFKSLHIDQVTNLDPHDWGVVPGINIVSDFDNHPNIKIACPDIGTFSKYPNNGTISWKGSGFNDTYFQENFLSGLDGRPVQGTFNCDWSPITFSGLPHSDIHYLYSISINNPDLGKSTKCSSSGYRFSRLGGEKRSQTSNFCDISIRAIPEYDFFKPMPLPNGEKRIRGIYNGSFDRGEGNMFIPGWYGSGGGFSRDGVFIEGETLLMRAINSNTPFIRHNNFYIPPDALNVAYKIKSGAMTKGLLLLKVNNEVVRKDTIFGREANFQKVLADVSKFNDKVVTISFEFLLIGGSSAARVYIDDVEFSKDQPSSTLFLFDLSGSMNDHGGGTTPKIEQAKTASKTTLNAMRSGSQGVVNQVAVYGFKGGCSPDPTIEISSFTTDLNAVERNIHTMAAGGGTPLANALRAAECKMAAHLQNEGQSKGKLIILSDGQGTCGSIRPPGVYNSAPLQRNRSVIVDANQCGFSNTTRVAVSYYTIGFNIPPGSPAERDLQYLSQVSGGKYLNVQNQTQLARAFRKFNRIYQPKENPALSSLPIASVNNFGEGVTQIKEEYYKEALSVYTNFFDQHPEDCHGVFNLALMQEANDFYKEAIANYEQYLSLCPDAFDREFVENQIKFLQEEFREFVLFQKEIVRSDLAFLDLHFQRIQNGQSVALANEFKGFLTEKDDYYQKLSRLIATDNSQLISLSEDLVSAFQQCAQLIRRNPQNWDRDAIPIISMAFLSLEELLEEM